MPARPASPRPTSTQLAGSGTNCKKPRISPPGNFPEWIFQYDLSGRESGGECGFSARGGSAVGRDVGRIPTRCQGQIQNAMKRAGDNVQREAGECRVSSWRRQRFPEMVTWLAHEYAKLWSRYPRRWPGLRSCNPTSMCEQHRHKEQCRSRCPAKPLVRSDHPCRGRAQRP